MTMPTTVPAAADRSNGTNGANGATEVQDVPLGEIIRSPFNRNVDTKSPEFMELVDSIRIHGVIQPGLARPLPSALDSARKPGSPRLELVIGEHRWLGSNAAKRLTMPLMVRQLTDVQVVELQTIENDKRKDLAPIEEAEKYQQLIDQYEKSGLNKEKAIAQLCEKLSKGKSTVYEALRLLKLPAAVKDLVKANKLPASHAGVLAQLEDAPDCQARLANLIVEKPKGENSWERKRDEQGVVSFRDTKALVAEQIDLIAARKKWETAAQKHRASGGEVMSAEQMAKSVTSYGHLMKPFIQASDYTYDYSANGSRYGELMGRHAPKPILAHDHLYRPIECYRLADVAEAIKANGKKKRSQTKPNSHRIASHSQVDQQKRKELARRMQPVVAAALESVLKSAETNKEKFPWGYFAGWVANVIGIFGDIEKELLNRFGWKKVVSKGFRVVDQTVAVNAAKLPLNKIQAVLLFLLLHDENEDGPWNEDEGKFSDSFKTICGHFHVDLTKLTKELTLDPAEKKEPRAKAAKGAKVQTPGKTSQAKKKNVGLTGAARTKLATMMKARWAARTKVAKK
jgi:ParB/RepB/Spo0J family partition protein